MNAALVKFLLLGLIFSSFPIFGLVAAPVNEDQLRQLEDFLLLDPQYKKLLGDVERAIWAAHKAQQGGEQKLVAALLKLSSAAEAEKANLTAEVMAARAELAAGYDGPVRAARRAVVLYKLSFMSKDPVFSDLVTSVKDGIAAQTALESMGGK
jgi:hypothetical protein